MDTAEQLAELIALTEAAPSKDRRKQVLAWMAALPPSEREPWQHVIDRAAPLLARGGGRAILQAACVPGTDPQILAAAHGQRTAPYLKPILGPWSKVAFCPLRTLSGHKAGPTAITVLGEGPWLSGGGEGDPNLRAWDPIDGSSMWTRRTPHAGGITSLAVDPSRRIVFTGSGQGDSRVFGWDLDTGKKRLALADLNADGSYVLYDADFLVVADGALHGWQPHVQTKKPLWQVIDPTDRSNGYVKVVPRSTAGHFGVLRLADGTTGLLEVREISTGALLHSFTLEHDFAPFRGFPEAQLVGLRDDRLLWIPYIGGQPTCLWDREGRKLAELPTPPSTRCGSFLRTSDGREWILFGDANGSVHLHPVAPQAASATDTRSVKVFGTEMGAITSIAASSDGSEIATAVASGDLPVWSTQKILDLPDEAPTLTDIGIVEVEQTCDHGPILVGARVHGTLVTWRPTTGVQVLQTPSTYRNVGRIAIAPDRPWVAISSRPRYDKPATVDVFDLDTGACLFANVYTVRSGGDAKFIRGGRLALLDSDRPEGLVVDVSTGKLLSGSAGGAVRQYRRLYVPPSYDGFYLAHSAHTDGPAFVDAFDENGTFRHSLMGHHGWIQELGTSPDPDIVWTAATDSTVRLWSHGTGECLSVLGTPKVPFNWNSMNGPYTRAAIIPAVKRAICTENHKNLFVYDLQTGHPCGQLQGHRKNPCAVVADPQGRWVLSADSEGSLILWDLAHLSAVSMWFFAFQVTSMTRFDDSTVVVVTKEPRLHILEVDGVRAASG